MFTDKIPNIKILTKLFCFSILLTPKNQRAINHINKSTAYGCGTLNLVRDARLGNSLQFLDLIPDLFFIVSHGLKHSWPLFFLLNFMAFRHSFIPGVVSVSRFSLNNVFNSPVSTWFHCSRFPV